MLYEKLKEIAELWGEALPKTALEMMLAESNKHLTDHDNNEKIALANAQRINNIWNLIRSQQIKKKEDPLFIQDAYFEYLKSKTPELAKFLK